MSEDQSGELQRAAASGAGLPRPPRLPPSRKERPNIVRGKRKKARFKKTLPRHPTLARFRDKDGVQAVARAETLRLHAHIWADAGTKTSRSSAAAVTFSEPEIIELENISTSDDNSAQDSESSED
eukprot:2765898-Amphidinium_carterae.1